MHAVRARLVRRINDDVGARCGLTLCHGRLVHACEYATALLLTILSSLSLARSVDHTWQAEAANPRDVQAFLVPDVTILAGDRFSQSLRLL